MVKWSIRLDVPERWFQSTRRFQVEEIRLIKVRSHALYSFAPAQYFRTSSIGTDHQRIAKLDRENEVAPPPKVSSNVGRVCS
jgi:hypothetical protein